MQLIKQCSHASEQSIQPGFPNESSAGMKLSVIDIDKAIRTRQSRRSSSLQAHPMALSDSSSPREAENGFDKPLQSGSTAASTRPWQDRLADLAHLASTSLGSDSREASVAPAIHGHLDAIESILNDPTPGITREIGRTRPSRDGSVSAALDDSQAREPELDEKSNAHVKDEQLLPQLRCLLEEATAVNRELNRRHEESIQIRDLFEERCRGLTRTVAELKDEVVELHSDLVEDAIELEGIQGTVRGLHGWMDGLCDTQKKGHATKLERSKSRRWGGRTSKGLSPETDAEMVLDGLSAWMRGWKDVEETFQARAGARKSRRDRRQEQFSRPGMDESAHSSPLVA
ncbi:hypothetical protein N7492_009050 [Penicillium capsulatum]|uniref:Uncharacterized protein n=1 Tax=Penicillium capsulatum TaxID=69766 RepID=A0A9W9HT58_9EURO|nr:hypothetical protein N7492_009050 [Penicillium capsulatum]KAJ6106448.1 hypothetical protein N7512_009965 [Penicillium capsulatum]